MVEGLKKRKAEKTKVIKGEFYMEQFIELGTLLKNIKKYCWEKALFLPDIDEWNEYTKGVVLYPNDVEEDDEIPQFAKDNDLIYALEIGTIQEIVDNAYQQNPSCTIEDLFDAYLYYYNNDAFILFESSSQ